MKYKAGEGQRKWSKMVEVPGAYKHIRYEQIWLNSLNVIFNVKVLAMDDSQPAGQPDKHNSLRKSI